MTQKLRVFISSTMEDLANERAAVVEQLKSVNLEPVNAEGILPTGGNSWDVLENEIRSSHIFVLILGNSYGWIPEKGHGADKKRSVTHLEVSLARELKLPILPFLKRLKYTGKPERTKDEERRDAFREEVEDWEKGQFRTMFDLAQDLAPTVRKALLDIFFDNYLKSRVRVSFAASTAPPAGGATVVNSEIPPGLPVLPGTGGTLFAGAGMSLAAGYPTASLLSEHLCRLIKLPATGDQVLNRHRFAEIAEFAETRIGRKDLLESVKQLLDTPQPIGPTDAHLRAVKMFEVILTTNYDELFEEACRRQGVEYAVSTSSDQLLTEDVDVKHRVMIYKLDGTIGRPDSLILTDQDAASVANNKKFWDRVQQALTSKPVTVVGHSLRDTTSRNLLAGRNLDLPGVYVAPGLDPIDQINLKRFRLTGIRSNAEVFMSALSGFAPVARI
jgi:hypothetical protein